MILFYIILSSTLISLLSLIGVLTISMNKKLLAKMIIFLVSLSAGAMMGGVFLHLLPEAIEQFSHDSDIVFTITLLSFSGFFLIEKILHWRHCHKENCSIHVFGYRI